MLNRQAARTLINAADNMSDLKGKSVFCSHFSFIGSPISLNIYVEPMFKFYVKNAIFMHFDKHFNIRLSINSSQPNLSSVIYACVASVENS